MIDLQRICIVLCSVLTFSCGVGTTETERTLLQTSSSKVDTSSIEVSEQASEGTTIDLYTLCKEEKEARRKITKAQRDDAFDFESVCLRAFKGQLKQSGIDSLKRVSPDLSCFCELGPGGGGGHKVSLGSFGGIGSKGGGGPVYGTPLLLAMYGGHDELAYLLLENGADPNMRVPGGKYNALQRALQFENEDLIKKLLEQGANLKNARLEYNITRTDTSYYKELLAYGANFSNVDPCGTGESMIAQAAFFKDQIGLEFLVRHGADVNYQNGFGATLLHDLVQEGEDVELVDFLLENGVDTSLRDDHGRTPYDIARGTSFNKEAMTSIFHRFGIKE